jgi:4-amino-4-deoxychorismate lyase
MRDWHKLGGNQRVIDSGERAFHYGDGLFETIAIRGGRPRLWDYHVDRLVAGSRRLGLDIPPSTALRRQLDVALGESDHNTDFCTAKIILTAGPSQRGYGRSMPTPAEIYVGLYAGVPLNRQAYEKGVSAIMCETRLAVGSPVAGLKTLNRIEQVLARSECLAAGAFEGLTRDADDRVICGTMSNVFIVKNNRLMTPSLERCGVAGTMRRHVIETLGRGGETVALTDLVENDLAGADEVFVTNSQVGIVPLQRCDGYAWPIGNKSREVMALLADNGIVECRG